MSFELGIGLTTLAGKREVNEDFAASMLPEPGAESMGAIAAIADGVSTGGMSKEAAQSTATSLVRDYFGTPETWDTTVALDPLHRQSVIHRDVKPANLHRVKTVCCACSIWVWP